MFFPGSIHQVANIYACCVKEEIDCWPSLNPSFPVSLFPPSLMPEPLKGLPASLAAPSALVFSTFIHSGLCLPLDFIIHFPYTFCFQKCWRSSGALMAWGFVGLCLFLFLTIFYIHLLGIWETEKENHMVSNLSWTRIQPSFHQPSGITLIISQLSPFMNNNTKLSYWK